MFRSGTSLGENLTRMIFKHSGDAGDIIAALPSIQQLLKERGESSATLLLSHSPRARQPMSEKVLANLLPLLSLQPCLQEIRLMQPGDTFDIDFDLFRDITKQHQFQLSLLTAHAKAAGINELTIPSQWLVCGKRPDAPQIVVNRTKRYHNKNGDWFWKLFTKGKSVGFVGSPQEHIEFQRELGVTLPHLQTRNLLELAETVNGCEVFAGNQSSPLWLAYGLGKRVYCECNPKGHNSFIQRPNVDCVHTIIESLASKSDNTKSIERNLTKYRPHIRFLLDRVDIEGTWLDASDTANPITKLIAIQHRISPISTFSEANFYVDTATLFQYKSNETVLVRIAGLASRLKAGGSLFLSLECDQEAALNVELPRLGLEIVESEKYVSENLWNLWKKYRWWVRAKKR